MKTVAHTRKRFTTGTLADHHPIFKDKKACALMAAKAVFNSMAIEGREVPYEQLLAMAKEIAERKA